MQTKHGVFGGVPPCFRFSPTEIHCLADEVDGFEIDLGSGDDVLEITGDLAEELEVDAAPERTSSAAAPAGTPWAEVLGMTA